MTMRAFEHHGEHETAHEFEQRFTDWGFLAHKKQLGKRVVCGFVSANSAAQAQISTVDMLNIQGEDEHAHECSITLCSPEIINSTLFNTAAKQAAAILQNASGEKDSINFASTLNNVGGKVTAGSEDISFANPIAILEWGVGGAACRAELDFTNGQEVKITASWLRLSGMIEGAPQTTLTLPYVLRAFIGPAVPGRQNSAQRTISVGALGNAVASSVFTIPRFARSVIVSSGDGSATPAQGAAAIQFWRSSGGQADGFAVGDFFTAANNPLPIPIPNGAYYFNILGKYAAGAGGLAAPLYNAIFQLAI